jgi:1D-myo-inositol-tetrakisphosphate 5-kinase/inositol-polyphosphate multikinase
MDDIAHGIKYPTVIDFKLGRITHDPEATPEKIQRQKSKYPPVERLGFQLIGMRVYNQADNSFSHYDKVYGRALSEQDLIHGKFHLSDP